MKISSLSFSGGAGIVAVSRKTAETKAARDAGSWVGQGGWDSWKLEMESGTNGKGGGVCM